MVDIKEIRKTLQDIADKFTEKMLVEFITNETAIGNKLITSYLEENKYHGKQIELIRTVLYMDASRNRW